MIKPKLKRCSVCHDNCILWKSTPPMCKDCSGKLKMAQRTNQGPYKHVTLAQTDSGGIAKPFKVIKKVSTKQQKLNTAYSALRKVFLEQNPYCKACMPGCTYVATEVHHKSGRGEYLLDTSTWLPTCHNDHVWIENNPVKAKELGLSLNRLDK